MATPVKHPHSLLSAEILKQYLQLNGSSSLETKYTFSYGVLVKSTLLMSFNIHEVQSVV